MEYVVGSVAALISGAGNTTPNRPRLVKRALTPTKHQPSPNVTPKSELVDDRSILLSPTLQKKKAIVKKSPKRIFQNPDLEITNDGQGKSSLTSPKADRVKKHLKDDLEANAMANKSVGKANSPKKVKHSPNKSLDSDFTKKKINTKEKEEKLSQSMQNNNESTPKKKKKQRNSITLASESDIMDEKENLTTVNIEIGNKSPKKNKRKSISELSVTTTDETSTVTTVDRSPKKKKRNSLSKDIEEIVPEDKNDTISQTEDNYNESAKKKKKHKKSQSQGIETENKNQNLPPVNTDNSPAKNRNKRLKKKSKKNQNSENPEVTTNKDRKTKVNQNAITNKDTDSEHDSDDEINSETEQTNNEILDTGPASSDEEEENEEVKKPQKKVEKDFDDSEVIKRTLFVGNVPFSKKCKKEIKKIFCKYGHIENVR